MTWTVSVLTRINGTLRKLSTENNKRRAERFVKNRIKEGFFILEEGSENEVLVPTSEVLQFILTEDP